MLASQNLLIGIRHITRANERKFNKWQCYIDGDVAVTYRGSSNIVLDVVALLKSSDFSTQRIQTILINNNGPTSAIIQILGQLSHGSITYVLGQFFITRRRVIYALQMTFFH